MTAPRVHALADTDDAARAGAALAATAAGRYESTIGAAFSGVCRCGSSDRPSMPRFDLVLLGLGANTHTASLFPDTLALVERDALVTANRVASLQATRITMTLPLLNAARQVMFLVAGADKAAAVRQVLESTAGPAARVQPRDGRVHWILDAGAASLVHASANGVLV